MLDFAGINYWAVLVVWAIYLIVGAYWYSEAGFAKTWTKYTGINILKIPTEKATKILIAIIASSLLQVLALALILNSLNVTEAFHGLLIGLVLWFGFTTLTTVGVTLYSNRSWKFIWLNSAYFLIVMAIGSMILAVWR